MFSIVHLLSPSKLIRSILLVGLTVFSCAKLPAPKEAIENPPRLDYQQFIACEELCDDELKQVTMGEGGYFYCYCFNSDKFQIKQFK